MYGADEDDEDELLEPPDPELPYPLWYSIAIWIAYRDHGKLPEPGAFNDQPQAWLDTIQALDHRFAYRAKVLRPELLPRSRTGRQVAGEDALAALFAEADGEAGDWRSVIGE